MDAIEKAEQRLREQAAQQKQAEQSRQELKRVTAQVEFGSLVAKKQQIQSQHAKQQAGKQARQGSASERWMARRGIAQVAFLNQRFQDNAQRQQTDRKARQLKAHEMATRHQQTRAEAEASDLRDPRAARDGARLSSRDGSRASKPDVNPESMPVQAVQMGGPFSDLPLQATSEIGTKSSGGSSVLGPSLQQIVDAMVEKIYQGVSVEGAQMLDIELKNQVWGGARLSIRSSKEGIILKIHTQDTQVESLLRHSEAYDTLSDALETKHLHLKSLEVNGKSMIGSRKAFKQDPGNPST